jgi:DNA-binding CsgD family transcriptional regulator
VFDEHGRLTASTEAAAAWLDELGVGGPDGLPWLVAGLVRHVRVAGRSVSTTVVTRTGRHGVVEAAALESGTATGVVVVVSAPPPELRLTRLAVASGLTPREVEVLEHVVAGRSTKQIAAALEISPYTVQAHLTSVFAKTGQRSRRELIGLLRG